jgi:cytochrome P450
VPLPEEAVYGATEFQEVADWDDVRFLLRSKSFEQVGPDDGYPRVGLQHMIIGDSVVMLRGEHHAERRHLESVLFRRPTLLMYERDLVRPRLRQALHDLPADGDGTVRADLNRISQDMLLELMLTLSGISLETPEKQDAFRALFGTLDSGSRVRHAVDGEKAVREGLAAQRRFAEEFFEPAWREHEQLLAQVEAGELEESALPNDLIMLMLRNRAHFDNWDAGVYLREATLFVIASVGTTTRELCLAVDAIERWLEQHPEDAERRTDEEFLERAFEESLRLHQSIPSVGRVAVEEVVLPSGARVAAGETVRVNLVGANRELLGDDADEFDPHRAPPPRGTRHGLAFSDGRHICPGKMLVLGDDQDGGARLGTAKTALLELYRAGMRRDATREPVMKDTLTRRFDSYPVVFENLGGIT